MRKNAKFETLQDVRIQEFDCYLFGKGTHYEIYKKLGAHPVRNEDVSGVYFAVWAPNAKEVSVVGDFNHWNTVANVMFCDNSVGIYEVFIPDVMEYDLYKFAITSKNGKQILKADPYGNHGELRPGNASKVVDISNFKWNDGDWLGRREAFDAKTCPMSIYEVHIGSWMRHPTGVGFYNYREFAHRIVEYVVDMGYTHVELIGIAEYPYDPSWGYQVTGYYAPTSRYGTPEDFAYLVNYLHQHNIGVILDWVPAHFPKDDHGLAYFDGTPTYEYADSRKGEHPEWGTKVFDYGKTEVQNFLIANALFWLEHYHIDGLRVDAVASMLYLDYGKEDGQWLPNQYGDNKNLEAMEFFRHLNHIVKERNPSAMMIAEESTAWPRVTGEVEEGSLGFTLKWNMGWMHDFTEYMKLDPLFRKDHHDMMTFSMVYAYTENYILVLSHDEVVHLKGSMINKMPGLGFDKFANLKAGYGFMFCHPGKKLLFMGQDFGQYREWSEERELDWFLLGEQSHQQLKLYVKDLLHLYKKHPAMYEEDTRSCGFNWINKDDNYRSIISYTRHSKDEKRNLLVVCNFTPVTREDYRVGTLKRKQHKLIFNGDDIKYGGTGLSYPEVFKPDKQECDGQEYSIGFTLAGYGVMIFEY
jgi:1,4-alpha-glucan branching enzyme